MSIDETTQSPGVRVPPPWEPPLAGTEVEHLLGALRRLRTTFRWKAGGLDEAGLSQRDRERHSGQPATYDGGIDTAGPVGGHQPAGRVLINMPIMWARRRQSPGATPRAAVKPGAGMTLAFGRSGGRSPL